MIRLKQIQSISTSSLICLFVLLSIACSSPDPMQNLSPTPAPKKRVLPITLIEQELPMSTGKSWELVSVALQQQNIPLAEVVEEENLIITKWIKMKDRLCNTATSGSAPVPCKTQYRIAVYPVSDSKSLLRIRYTEDCTGEYQVFLTCPYSMAETRMIDLVGDIKALAGIPQ